jgi:hypothetical protein
MLPLHSHAGLGGGAQVLHFAIVALGILGLVALLTPHVLVAREHATPRAPEQRAARQALVPLAVVSSTAAAGVHAAVAPEHFRESLLPGWFFVGLTLLQLVWAVAVATADGRLVLRAGAAGNLAVIGLWVVTRTLGLPFGLLGAPEPVGPWDLACAGWELVVVCTCLAMLRSPRPRSARLVSWRLWHPALPTYVAASVLVLVGLSLSGAGA